MSVCLCGTISISNVLSDGYIINTGFVPNINIRTIYDYKTFLKECKQGTTNVNSIGGLLGILSGALFKEDELDNQKNPQEMGDINKRVILDMIEETLPLLLKYPFLDELYFLCRAQTSVLKGDYFGAIEYYEKVLQKPEIISPSTMNKKHYCGELETAAKLAHNIAAVYMMAEKPVDSYRFRKKYEELFRIEQEYRTSQIDKYFSGTDSKSADVRRYTNKSIDELINNMEIIYYDDDLQFWYLEKDNSLLDAIIRDTKRENAPYTKFSFRLLRLERTDNKVLFVKDYEDPDQPILLRSREFRSKELMKAKNQSTVFIRFAFEGEKIASEEDIALSNRVGENGMNGEDLQSPKNELAKPKKKNPYNQLEQLIGLASIKKDVSNLIDFVKIQQMRKERGLKPIPVSLHMVFSGNPGTGKTTVARLLAAIYKDIGVLSKGHLVEVDRAGLVAGYVGQTAIKTQKVIDEATGGVLFIDEAYTLAKGGNDFGQEAIDTILKAMEDNREDFIVIVAGYSSLMDSFINSNPGLRSRFNKYMFFPDYTVDEMTRIFSYMCKEYGLKMSDKAKVVMTEKIICLKDNKGSDFANARDVRNLFEETLTRQASRLVQAPTEDIQLLIAEDFG